MLIKNQLITKNNCTRDIKFIDKIISFTKPRLILKNVHKDCFVKKTATVKKLIDYSLPKTVNDVDIYNTQAKIGLFFRRVKIKNQPELTKGIKKVIKKFPEFFNIFKPIEQYKGLLYKHVLSAFKLLINNEDFKKLTPEKQNLLEITTLLHDMGKTVVGGPKHVEESVKIVTKMLKKKQIKPEDKTLILKLIENHHFSEDIVKGRKSYEDYAKVFNENEFNLLKILITSDIKSKTKPVGHWLEANEIMFKNEENAIKAKQSTSNN